MLVGTQLTFVSMLLTGVPGVGRHSADVCMMLLTGEPGVGRHSADVCMMLLTGVPGVGRHSADVCIDAVDRRTWLLVGTRLMFV